MLALPERDEAKDLLGLLALADVGVRIAVHLAISVLGEEGEARSGRGRTMFAVSPSALRRMG